MNKSIFKILSCILILSLLLPLISSCRGIFDQGNGQNDNIGDNSNGSIDDNTGNDSANDDTHHVCEWVHVEDILSPTCVADGIATYMCSCGQFKTEILGASGHRFSEWENISLASCEIPGEQRQKCSICDLENTRYVNKLEHEYVITEEEINCVKTKTYCCSSCNDTFVVESILSEKFEGIGTQSLSDCSANFSFYVISGKDEAYIKNNLTIFDEYYEGTEYENSEGVVCSYDLTSVDTNVWLVTPKKAYTPGNTYKVTKNGDIIFKDYGLYDFTFSIFKEETQIIDVNNDIIFLQNLENRHPGYYPYTLEFSENSNTYWLTLGKIDGLNIGDVICVGDAENADALFQNHTRSNTFGKVETAHYIQNGGYYLLSLSVPSMSEIFDSLEIYSTRMKQIGESCVDEDAFAENVTEALLCDGDFINFAAASYTTALEYAQSRQLASHTATFQDFLDSIQITQNPKIHYDEKKSAIVGNLTITGQFSFPLTFSSSKDSEIGSIVIKFEAMVTINEFKIITSYSSEEDLRLSEKDEIDKLKVGAKQTVTLSFEFGIEISLDHSKQSQQYLRNTESGVYHYINCKHIKSIKKENISKISTKNFIGGVIDGAISVENECGSCKPVTAITTHAYIIHGKVVHLPNCSHVDLSSDNFRVSTLEYGNLKISGYEGCNTCHPEQRITTSNKSFSDKLLDKIANQDFGASIDEIKKISEKVKQDSDKGRIPAIPTIYLTLGPFDISFDLYVYVDFELKASLNYKYEMTLTTEYGLKKQGRNMVPYHPEDQKRINENLLTAIGSTRLDIGINPEVRLSFIGLEKVLYLGLSAKTGIYAEMNGALQYDFLDSNNNYMAAYFESGIHYAVSAIARIPIIIAKEKEIPIVKDDIALLTLGYEKLYYNYVDPPKQIELSEIRTSLDRDDLMTVKSYDLAGMKESTARLKYLGENGRYSISYSLADGSNCRIENGTIVITDFSERFTDKLTIKVTGYDDWTKVNNKNICFFLPEITIDIVFESSVGLEYMLNSDGASYSLTGIGTCTDTNVIIPSEYKGKKVTNIGEAFSDCNITSVTIPDSVISIGDYAFSRCYNLVNITIPSNVESIGYRVFYNCQKLKSINVDSANKYYKSIDGVLYSKDGTELIQYTIARGATSFNIPNGVKKIHNWAFYNCDILRNVTFPDGLEKIGYGAFEYCCNLTSVHLPDSVTDMGYWTFGFCESITSVTIPKNIIDIGGRVFSNCTGLTNVTIPDGVKSLGNNIFWGCSNLESIVLPASLKSIGDGAFDYCYSLGSVYYKGNANSLSDVSIGLYNSYFHNATLYYWNEFCDIPDDVMWSE